MNIDLLPKRLFDRIAFEPNTGCWLWNGTMQPVHGKRHGYGTIYGGNYTLKLAHRVVFEAMHGRSIKHGLEIDHLCRVHLCVNPDHLEEVTRKENQRRGFGCCGIHAKKTHCSKGHIFQGDNLKISKRGHRVCIACRSEMERNRWERRKLLLKAKSDDCKKKTGDT